MKRRSGVDLISIERSEQTLKHNYDADHDDSINSEGQLEKVAMYLLSGNDKYFPSNWGNDTQLKFFKKDRIEQLKIAGALIAAEIDRLQRRS